jgi:hypothetical protein
MNSVTLEFFDQGRERAFRVEAFESGYSTTLGLFAVIVLGHIPLASVDPTTYLLIPAATSLVPVLARIHCRYMHDQYKAHQLFASLEALAPWIVQALYSILGLSQPPDAAKVRHSPPPPCSPSPAAPAPRGTHTSGLASGPKSSCVSAHARATSGTSRPLADLGDGALHLQAFPNPNGLLAAILTSYALIAHLWPSPVAQRMWRLLGILFGVAMRAKPWEKQTIEPALQEGLFVISIALFAGESLGWAIQRQQRFNFIIAAHQRETAHRVAAAALGAASWRAEVAATAAAKAISMAEERAETRLTRQLFNLRKHAPEVEERLSSSSISSISTTPPFEWPAAASGLRGSLDLGVQEEEGEEESQEAEETRKADEKAGDAADTKPTVKFVGSNVLGSGGVHALGDLVAGSAAEACKSASMSDEPSTGDYKADRGRQTAPRRPLTIETPPPLQISVEGTAVLSEPPAQPKKIQAQLFRSHYEMHMRIAYGGILVTLMAGITSSGILLGSGVPVAIFALGRVWLHRIEDDEESQRMAAGCFIAFDYVTVLLNVWTWYSNLRAPSLFGGIDSPRDGNGQRGGGGEEMMASMIPVAFMLQTLYSFVLSTIVYSMSKKIVSFALHVALTAATPWPLPIAVRDMNLLINSALLFGATIAFVADDRARSRIVLKELETKIALQKRSMTDSLLAAPAPKHEQLALMAAFDERKLPSIIERRRIDIREIAIGHVLGSGVFGVVYAANWQGRSVAAKVLHRHQLNHLQLRLTNRAAACELGLAPHPNIVRLHGMAWSCEHGAVLLVMDACRRGSLADCFRDESTSLSWAQQLQISTGVARGLAFLHGQQPPLIHRDLKPDNVLLDADMRAKIADFGASRPEGRDKTMTALVGTPLFCAPETFLSEHSSGRKYSWRVDIWAYGCLLVCISTCSRLPFTHEECEDELLLQRIVQGKQQPSLPEGFMLSKAVTMCCQFCASKRPTAAELLRELDFDLNPSVKAPSPEIYGRAVREDDEDHEEASASQSMTADSESASVIHER